ncbi:hypothetical protein ROMU108268_22030 [Roseomonas mucosa]
MMERINVLFTTCMTEVNHSGWLFGLKRVRITRSRGSAALPSRFATSCCTIWLT